VALGVRGPVLEAVHDRAEIEARFGDRLTQYQRDAVRSLACSAWKWPFVFWLVGSLIALLLVVISIQLLKKQLQLSSACAFLACLAAAAYSARRLWLVWRELGQIQAASDELNRFLSLQVVHEDDSRRANLQRVTQRAELEHVTLEDSRGRRLLEDLSISFQPGDLTGIVSNQPLQSLALAEMLIGFGRPSSGRMLVDGWLLSDLQSHSLTSNSHWVADDGALLTGTISQNIIGSQIGKDLHQAIEQAGLRPLISRLPDGVNTLITQDDDRLREDDAFRIAIARGLTRQASVYVVIEPGRINDAAVEAESLAAIRQLVGDDRICIVLPERIGTIRACERIAYIHDHKLVDVGPHADLIQRNELYRHYIYLRFNRFSTEAE
jgi:ABC-type transport system involved in cytochrome bd biosynthesis fused ATPase/permease subunit